MAAPMRLEGRMALVTGGTGGIGAATCSRLAAEGARVAVADLDLDRARELAADLGGLGVELDVRSPESVRAAVSAIESELAPVDVLVNNAGIADDDFFVRSTEEQWDRLLGGEPARRAGGDPRRAARDAGAREPAAS